MTHARTHAALCCLLLAFVAACDVNFPNRDDCADLAEVCPELTCSEGFLQNEEGCPMCECAPPSGPTVCWTTDECAADRVCDHVNFCEPAPSCAEGGECPDVCYGLCVPVTSSCRSDLDCEAGEFCNFQQATGGGSNGGTPEPAPDDGSTDPAPPPDGEEERPVTSDGVCTPLGCGFAEFPACPPGTTPILDFANDPCGQARCEAIDACRELTNTDACDTTSGCHSEALPCGGPDGDVDCEPELVCVSDQGGCDGLAPDACAANPACEGYFIDGAGCSSVCTPDGCPPCESTPQDFVCVARISDGTCSTDAECLVGERCELTTSCTTYCQDDADAGTVCVDACWSEGLCTASTATCWDLTPETCLSDPTCELVDVTTGGASDQPCTCDPSNNTCDCGGSDAPAATTQVCQPIPATSCFDDTGCAQGQYCEVSTYCPPCVDGTDPACFAPCWIEGRCIDGVPAPTDCSDGMICETGTHCEQVELCTDCAQPTADTVAPPDCTGTCGVTNVCVADEPPATCTGDIDCGANERCNTDVCATRPADGTTDPPTCQGICEALPLVSCYSDYDCTDTQMCDFSQGCGGTASGPGMLVAQCGVCVERNIDPPPPPPSDGTYCQVSDDCTASLGAGATCREPNSARVDANAAATICLANPAAPNVDLCWGYCVAACGDALTAATDPKDGQCYVFADTCVPPGFTTGNGSTCSASSTP